jgi:dihydroorotate dehydrogenase (fumarate)
MAHAAGTTGAATTGMDTATSYLGIKLAHPFIAGASPLGYSLDTIKRLEDAGCAAIVLHSLFEEQISLATEGHVGHADPLDEQMRALVAAYPAPADYKHGPDGYAEHIVKVKQAVRIPVIASLNGHSGESWLKFARVIEQAGPDALEFNFYDVPAAAAVSSAALEENLVNAVRNLTRAIDIPVAVKLTPFYTSFAHVAGALERAGARRLHWLALLHGRVRPSLAVSGGVATPDDGIKALLAGAAVLQLVSALLRHGLGHLSAMRQGLERWLEWRQLSSVAEMIGCASFQTHPDPASLERAHYIRTLHSWSR